MEEIEKREEKKKVVLEFMNDDKYVPMKAKEIAFILGVTKDKFAEFHEVLKELENEYKIQCTKKGKYLLVDSNVYKTGTLRLNQKGFGFVEIDKNEEVFISKGNINNALNEDLVLVEILDDSNDELHKEGKIVKIVKHGKDTIVGTFQNSKNFGFVIPDDSKYGTDIFISKKNFGSARNNQKVVVKITKFAEKGKKAEGKIVEVLGNKDQAGVDMLSLIKEYNLPYEFPEQVLKEAKSLECNISDKEIKSRLDLRDKKIFTIDGEDAKDLDDAVC